VTAGVVVPTGRATRLIARPRTPATTRTTASPSTAPTWGFTARAYHAAGGFPSVPTGEDRAFVAALEATGQRVLRTARLDVVTSARRHFRAPYGFGHLLRTLDG
jgi:hypothetical protein